MILTDSLALSLRTELTVFSQHDYLWNRPYSFTSGMSGSAWTRMTKEPSLVCAVRETVLKILQQSRARGRTSASSAPRCPLFKEEDTKSESGLENAIKELGIKLKDCGAAVHG